MPAD
jgi:hypothetical protein